MHEYSLIASLIDRVEAEASARGAVRIHGLRVRIGELSGVEIDLLRTAYETFRARTVCRDAALEILPVEAEWACPSCERRIERGAVLRCADCERPARLRSGDEILLDQIEMEIPDV